MIKRIIICVFITLAVTVSGFSDQIKVKGTAPTFKTNDPTAQPYIDDFNRELASAFDEMLDGLNGMIEDTVPSGFLNSNDILGGFGNASIFATHGATMRAYGEYESLSISIGGIMGLQVPENTMDLINGKIDAEQFFSSNKLSFGINPQAFNLHVGFNPSSLITVLPENLYFGLRIGFFGLPKLEFDMGEGLSSSLDFNTFTIGVTANYQLVPSVNLGLIIWRGVNVGSGLIFQTTKLGLSMPLDRMEESIGDAGGGLDNLTLVLDPTVTLNMNINTVTIPVEIVTAVKLIFLNIPFGLGFDIGFGQSDLSLGLKSGVSIDGGKGSTLQQDKSGSLSVGISNKAPPQFFNLKLITGFGLAFGEQFVIDFPFTYYFTSSGFNLGMTIGLRF